MNNNIFIIKLLNKIERYEDNIFYVDKYFNNYDKFNMKILKKINFCYKNIIGQLRTVWRKLNLILSEFYDGFKINNDIQRNIVKDYINNIEKNIHKKCDNIIKKCDMIIIINSINIEERIFTIKIISDYYRYKSEISKDFEKKNNIEKTSKTFKQCYDLCLEKLVPIHYLRLTIFINYSIFIYEDLNNPFYGFQLCKKGYDEAQEFIKQKKITPNKEEIFLIEKLLENIKLWTSEIEYNIK